MDERGWIGIIGWRAGLAATAAYLEEAVTAAGTRS